MDLFTYGTLRAPALMGVVAGGDLPAPVAASLPNYRLSGDVIPLISQDISAHADGLLWSGLAPDQKTRLDLYEGAFGYVLQDVTLADGRAAQCYMPPDDADKGQGAWDFAAWQVENLTPALLTAEELFAHNPLPDKENLRRMWPMMQVRAWQRYRAVQDATPPAEIRYAPKPVDTRIVKRDPPQGQFFRLTGTRIQHRTYVGNTSDLLPREVFQGVDAALLLPYDPVRDKLVLVEQMRMGPLMRDDPNPWVLEPVAGIVDAGETPQVAARREAMEEAGLEITALEQIARFYPSPGASTDYFYCYLGLCDLPMDAPYMGGLPDEAEDLRLHPLSFDAALALSDSGEVTAGPLILMLHWLLRHRDRLRKAG